MSLAPNKISQFWQELKRRKVVRAITVYAAAAFVILELVSIIVEPLRMPEWTLQFAIVFLCIGFIIAIILSWIYDINPERGIVKTEPAHKVEAEDVPKSSNSWKIASYISFVVIVGLIVLNIIPRTGKEEILDKSIAVLPFRNDSPDEENIHFINGTMEAILDNLCKIEDLRVPGRTSIEQYRGVAKPIPVIAEEMNVSYILEGSGQKLGNRILLTVQLLDGKHDQHLWSKQYDREIQKIEDLIDISSEIAQLVAGEIRAIITPEEKELIEKIPTTSLTAYDFYQRGREEHVKFWLNPDNREALERAENLYYEALEYDSAFAQAYTGLAWVYMGKHYWETLLTENFLDSMLILADIALSFDDQLAEVYEIRGDYYNMHNNKEQAIIEYDKTIKLSPNYGWVYRQKGSVYFDDDLVKAIYNFQIAASLERGHFLPGIYRTMGRAYTMAGFKETSCHYIKEALKLDDDSAAYYLALTDNESIIGNYEKAIEFGEKSYDIDSADYWIINLLGKAHMFIGQFKESLEYYEKFDKRLETLDRLAPNQSYRIGYAYWVNGFKEEGEYYINTGLEMLNHLIKADRRIGQDFQIFYHLAAIYAFLGEKDKAYENLKLLNQRQKMPVSMVAMIKDDPMFDSIRDEPEFQQIIRDVEAKYQAEHDRIRKWLEENDML